MEHVFLSSRWMWLMGVTLFITPEPWLLCVGLHLSGKAKPEL